MSIMLTEEIKKIIDEYDKTKMTVKKSLNTDHIESLKSRGFVSAPNCSVSNHLYFYMKTNNRD